MYSVYGYNRKNKNKKFYMYFNSFIKALKIYLHYINLNNNIIVFFSRTGEKNSCENVNLYGYYISLEKMNSYTNEQNLT
jgi:hypothetical protein